VEFTQFSNDLSFHRYLRELAETSTEDPHQLQPYCSLTQLLHQVIGLDPKPKASPSVIFDASCTVSFRSDYIHVNSPQLSFENQIHRSVFSVTDQVERALGCVSIISEEIYACPYYVFPRTHWNGRDVHPCHTQLFPDGCRIINSLTYEP
jgi:hypothetical protein